MIINEELLYYVWQYKIFDHQSLRTISGDTINILQYGQRNFSSGPDFSNVKIEINGIVWAGNMEIHVLSSDWKKHKHDADDAYKNVVLHVVYENDKNHLPENIPVLVLKNRIDQLVIRQFSTLMEATTWIPCEKTIKLADLSTFPLWSTSLAIERLSEKTRNIQESFSYKSGDWVQLLHERIARYFGSKENSDNFERLASLLSYNLTQKLSHNRLSIEAVVFGCAGFLDEPAKDDYHQDLISEYQFQKSKYKLHSLKKIEWKNFGMFPSGQPTFRLAQFAAYLIHTENIFDICLKATHFTDFVHHFTANLSPYWTTHYVFGKETKAIKSNKLSVAMVERIVINAIVPVLFCYAHLTKEDMLKDQCMSILESMPSENNAIINRWKTLGINAYTAMESQALLQLKHRYCHGKQCLRCNIGIDLIKVK